LLVLVRRMAHLNACSQYRMCSHFIWQGFPQIFIAYSISAALPRKGLSYRPDHPRNGYAGKIMECTEQGTKQERAALRNAIAARIRELRQTKAIWAPSAPRAQLRCRRQITEVEFAQLNPVPTPLS